jgi:hypothetical protein
MDPHRDRARLGRAGRMAGITEFDPVGIKIFTNDLTVAALGAPFGRADRAIGLTSR